jgi:hypothetical protein
MTAIPTTTPFGRETTWLLTSSGDHWHTSPDEQRFFDDLRSFCGRVEFFRKASGDRPPGGSVCRICARAMRPVYVEVRDLAAFDAAAAALIAGNNYDFCDFPTGWAFQRLGAEHELVGHHSNCSAGPAGDGAFLCDCGLMLDAWRRAMDLAGRTRRY